MTWRSERCRSSLMRWLVTFAIVGLVVAPPLAVGASSTISPTSRTTATTVPTSVTSGVVVIEGRGFGHGVGLAQDGAYWLGLSGRTAPQILNLFYPGTKLARRGGPVRVPLAAASSVTLSFPAGGRIGEARLERGETARVDAVAGTLRVTAIRTAPTSVPDPSDTAPSLRGGVARLLGAVVSGRAPGRPLRPQFGRAQVTPDPNPPVPTPTPVPASTAPIEVVPVLIDPTTTVAPAVAPVGPSPESAPTPASTTPTPADPASPTAAGGPTTVPGGPVDVGPLAVAESPAVIGIGGRRYRGTMELNVVGGSIKVTNVVDVEDYLRGMGEILTGWWPPAALQAQAIVARTYALRAMGSVGEVCPTQRCQVYLGAQAEYKEMDAAVAATRGKVVVFDGKLAATYYSASGGGTIATPAEGFGAGSKDVPYLKAGWYPTGDLHTWRVTISLRELARRVGYPGVPSSVRVSGVGPSGRVTEVTVEGAAGSRAVGGPAFDAALGLKSTLFSFGAGSQGMADSGDTATDGASETENIVDGSAAPAPAERFDPLAIEAAPDAAIAIEPVDLAASDSVPDTTISSNTSPPASTEAEPLDGTAPPTTAAPAVSIQEVLNTPSNPGARGDGRAVPVLVGLIAAVLLLIAATVRRLRRTT